VAKAAGPDWRCGLATGEEMVGVLRAMASLQSWSGAGLLGVIRALIRDDDPAFLGRSRHGDLPDEWDESLVHEISLALAVSAPSAGKTTRAAWELGARLRGVELLLRDGTLDLPRARLITEVFEDLSDDDCARAEELLIPRLTEPPRKTYTQIERIATAIAAEVDPGLAERRRKAAEKHRSRVMMFREGSGTAALSGRDLPTDQTLAAFAHVNARAQVNWALTVPSGLELTLNLEPVPTYECDHRHESHAYKPNATLRHLVQIRDHTCTFPPCSRHARDSDFEHATPYDQGGRTCASNAGARSRKCHRIKQSPGWNVTQPRPGWHQWTTPRGRTYTQGPKRYPV
jgi:hypothetical protein